ncbi:MAG: enoyl-CoA hydratase/isomerase family protein [Terriglobales bacterium]
MIQTIHHGPIRELRLNRPPVNALTGELITALRQAVESAPKDDVRALVLSGTPGRFSAGLDVPLLMTLDRRAITALWRELYALMKALACSPIPIAAAIIGHAPAGGTVLPLFCDWRIMADGEFKIGLSEVQVGIPLPAVILAALRRQVGPRQAERLASSGLLMSPAKALEIGLVDELVPTEHVVERAIAWCNTLLALPSEAMLTTRREARADLIAIFRRDLEPEVKKVVASWWHPETQATLRAVVDQLKKKK